MRVRQEVCKQTVPSKQDLMEKAQAGLEKLTHMPKAVKVILCQPEFRYAAEPA